MPEEALIEQTAESPDAERLYVYMFIRLDISRDQRIIQSVHAALRAGARYYVAGPDGVLPRVNVVLIGAKNEVGLSLLMSEVQANGTSIEKFNEPDMAGSLTAFATEPIKGAQRDFFKKFRSYGAGRPDV